MILTQTNEIPPTFDMRGGIDSIMYPSYAEIKLDGEYNVLYVDPINGHKMLNKNGLMRTGGLVDVIGSKYKEDRILIGELYYGAGLNGNLYKLLEDRASDNLNFKPFDIVKINGMYIGKMSYQDRLKVLCLTPKIVYNQKQLEEYFREVTGNGYEGLVVKNMTAPFRSGTCSWVKLKKKDRNNYPIVHIDKTRERVEIRVDLPGGKSRVVGVKVIGREKRKLSIGDMIIVEHCGILSGGGLRHPQYKGLANGK